MNLTDSLRLVDGGKEWRRRMGTVKLVGPAWIVVRLLLTALQSQAHRASSSTSCTTSAFQSSPCSACSTYRPRSTPRPGSGRGEWHIQWLRIVILPSQKRRIHRLIPIFLSSQFDRWSQSTSSCTEAKTFHTIEAWSRSKDRRAW